MLFEFIPKAEDGSQITLADNIKVVDDTHSTLYTQKFFELVNEFSKPQMSYPQLKAVGFSIIACASQALCEKVIFRQNLSSIYSGIQYLENNPAQDKSIDEIAKMCGVSLTYFERLFKEYSGMSPTRYRTLRKIDMAKAMLKNPLLSIEQIADELNYYDCAYFCKCFKKATGMTAHEYRLNAQGT